MKKIIISILVGVFSVGCSKGGDGGSPSPVVQSASLVPLSGTFLMHDVQCYSSTSLQTMTHASNYSGAITETQTFAGNDFTGTLSDGVCTVTLSATLSFTPYAVSILNETVTSVTGGSCTISETLNGTDISPGTISKTYTTGQVLGTMNNIPYIYDAASGTYGFETIYTDGSGGVCLLLFEKQ